MVESRRIGPYRILEPLGRGGMGVVYRARHVSSERAVALKTVTSAGHFNLDGLRREIIALTTIRHPGVVRIVDHGTHEGLPWYAMDLLEGESLRRFGARIWSRFRGPVTAVTPQPVTATDALSGSRTAESGRDYPAAPPQEPGERPPAAAGELEVVLGIMRRICATVGFLHGEGFINCDLKPDNCLLADGAPVLIDFGLTAHHPGGSGREALEAQRGMSGTLLYMSPEQIRGEFVDARSDLYAIGCMLYELVVGRPPFAGSPAAMTKQHLAELATPPSELVQDLPPELERAILKLLAKDMSERFGYADEVAAVLADIARDGHRLANFPPARSYLYRPGFVGRERVVAELSVMREQAIHGLGKFVLIAGESGVGKTRLAMELTRLMPTARMRIVTSEIAPPSAATSLGGSHPLYALRSLLLAIADVCHEGGPATTEQLLGDRRSVLALYEPLLAEVPAHDRLSPPPALSTDAARQRLFRCLWETIAAFARERPLLWVVDDLNWADELSLSFLASVSPAFLESNPIFIVGTHRSEEPSASVAAIGALDHVTHLTLPRLDRDGVCSMVSDMLAMREPASDFLDFVAQQTEGNPFFVAEYLRSAVGDRILFRDANAWRLPSGTAGSPRDFQSLPLPHALRELVERRLSSVSPAGTQVALAAAVLGRDMRVALLERVAGLPEDTFVGALGELIRRQVFEQPVAESVRFAHDKLREVAYAQAPAGRRRDLHATAAAALEAYWSDRPDASRGWANLGHHFAAAQHAEKAATYLRLAADHARATYANDDAIELYQRALEQTQQILLQLTADPTPWLVARLDLHEAIGDVLCLAARREEARASFLEALRNTPPQDQVRLSRLHRKTGKTWETQHQHDEALHCYAAAEAALGTAPFAAALRDEWLQVCLDRLWVYYWLDRVPEMDALIATLAPTVEKEGSPLQRAQYFDARTKRNLRLDKYVIREETLRFARLELVASEQSRDFAQILQARFGLGFVLVFHGQPEAASVELRHALELAEQAGDLAQQARCLTYLAMAARLRGDVTETRGLTLQADAMSTRAAMLDYVAVARANQAWLALHEGAPATTLRLAAEAMTIWRSRLSLVFAFQWLALLPAIEAALATGDLPRAAADAAALLDPSQQPLPGAAADALARAQRHFGAGNTDAARTALDQALTQLRPTEYR